ncbi:mgtA regulatory leader peptide MgtL [Escherichia coli]|nr:mgtA regulatory leader peptide MgtL [Escherichia coli]MBW6097855.1 mgtA regulatory leader peptide MgtL [Escherichia coli]MBW9313348.1 mgtA regulatory leader peptide MgtL [Escherichia coli]
MEPDPTPLPRRRLKLSGKPVFSRRYRMRKAVTF